MIIYCGDDEVQSMVMIVGRDYHWLDQNAGVFEYDDDVLTVQAGDKTDWFIDPATMQSQASAPVLLSPVDGDCQLTALVEVDFRATFDAGVLFVHQGPDRYAKLCFELSPAGERTVVSVVTHGSSDDANGPVIEGGQVWLRVSVIGAAVAFHWSLDGEWWNLKRYFRLAGGDASTALGFCSQSPTGDGCLSRFHHIRWTPTTLHNVRNGS